MMIRELQEQWERDYLSEYARLSVDSKGRDREEPQCDLRTVFQRDRDRILHCKAFRRLKHKTQVFLEPEGDHYRTRLTHTLEVSQNARTLARALRLNEDLTEAIALGHDLGHTPFGHAGERALNDLYKDGFRHNEQSVRVVELLENKGRGLNLTVEVRDGILNHQTSLTPATLEGRCVRVADKIAYINADIDDSVRAGLISENDIPKEISSVLGHSYRARINTMIHDIIINSQNKNDIVMSDEVKEATFALRKFLFERVYKNPVAKAEEAKVGDLIGGLFNYYYVNMDRLPEEYTKMVADGQDKERIICDYIAGMTDQYAIHCFEDIYIPRAWSDI
ncbi:MAG: deoxyguanosinetriphosphate triphosphohydrolase [Lachnospiraceae bacterium]|nr:deoxyguanosinetriphosphate triphosphohydrolase [Lachnospiraceae bacterium]